MARFDRYMLSQLLQLFGFFSLILVAVYWINSAVGLFDDLIGDGQSALVFLEFSLLTLPNVIRLVLPISAFVATVYVVNRLTAESELVVMQATGFSSFRLARPVVFFGLFVAAMMLILMNILVPLSRTMLADRTAEVQDSLAAQFIRDGEFLHPADGLTLFIREIGPNGEIGGLFLQDSRGPSQVTYTAGQAYLVRADSGPKLVMIDGMAQTLENGRLAVTRFADFTYDIGAMLSPAKRSARRMNELSTIELLHPTDALAEETRSDRAEMVFEGHDRLGQPFLGLAASLIGFAALLMGGFSRFGLWRQIAVAIVLLIVVQMINTVASSAGPTVGWPLAYAAPIAGCAIGAVLLVWSQRPRRLAR
ncbi:LPS export ABC transporter permease LptF [Falsirhodobacter algicola]|uniref:LPS export ABC transporter permease LptF n=1 Tax=Falsirhodobacter algicola TaxID=2692330 RepID=A0A8J8MSB9_9RHOB|nr:LPS export ABC transporter permease LptF [Falsirhodobacter algicola]QUS35619.1 LPS export ABC transporter permease LptF [Falsirhodobacter algicola]